MSRRHRTIYRSPPWIGTSRNHDTNAKENWILVLLNYSNSFNLAMKLYPRLTIGKSPDTKTGLYQSLTRRKNKPTKGTFHFWLTSASQERLTFSLPSLVWFRKVRNVDRRRVLLPLYQPFSYFILIRPNKNYKVPVALVGQKNIGLVDLSSTNVFTKCNK